MRGDRTTYENKKAKQKHSRNRKRRQQKKVVLLLLLFLIFILILKVCFQIKQTIDMYLDKGQENVVTQEEKDNPKQDEQTPEINNNLTEEERARKKIQNFAKENHLSMSDYPDELIESFIANPEKEEFVLHYPLKKDSYSKQRLKECLGQSELPLLLQWDPRWGYYPYGNGIIGVLGCGPTSLSMVAIHLLQDASLTPIYMADYAMQNGYYAQGVGTAWDLMTDGARRLGLKVQEVSLDKNVVMRHLQKGRPIICAMGPGDFTQTGHFIVLTGVENGKIRINDCNSKSRSEKLWDFESFQYQIKNMWAYSLP